MAKLILVTDTLSLLQLGMAVRMLTEEQQNDIEIKVEDRPRLVDFPTMPKIFKDGGGDPGPRRKNWVPVEPFRHLKGRKR